MDFLGVLVVHSLFLRCELLPYRSISKKREDSFAARVGPEFAGRHEPADLPETMSVGGPDFRCHGSRGGGNTFCPCSHIPPISLFPLSQSRGFAPVERKMRDFSVRIQPGRIRGRSAQYLVVKHRCRLGGVMKVLLYPHTRFLSRGSFGNRTYVFWELHRRCPGDRRSKGT